MTAPASTLLQRVTGWFGGLPGKAADVLPVRLGVTEYRQSSSTPASVLGFDQALLWVVVALLAWGLVMCTRRRLPCRTTRALPTMRPPIS